MLSVLAWWSTPLSSTCILTCTCVSQFTLVYSDARESVLKNVSLALSLTSNLFERCIFLRGTEMADRSGQQLGNYRLLRLLGRGGFAEVYLGQHIYLGSQAALKVLPLVLNDEDIESFAKEARILASLNHPHIVRVLDFAVENGTPFLVMQYAINGTLRQLHPHNSRLSGETVISYVQQIASALQYAHDQH